MARSFQQGSPIGVIATGWAFLAMVAGIAFALFVVVQMTPASAGEVNDLDGVAIKGRDPVAYFTLGKAVEGARHLTATHKGATFRFATEDNRAAFVARPEAYAPQYGGFCAFGTSRGYKADIDPQAFTVTDGRLYLNYSKNIQAEWRQDIAGFVAKADANWPAVAKTDKVYR